MGFTNASGNRALKYGTTKHEVLGLEVVLADGRIIETGSMMAKSSAATGFLRACSCTHESRIPVALSDFKWQSSKR